MSKTKWLLYVLGTIVIVIAGISITSYAEEHNKEKEISEKAVDKAYNDSIKFTAKIEEEIEEVKEKHVERYIRDINPPLNEKDSVKYETTQGFEEVEGEYRYFAEMLNALEAYEKANNLIKRHYEDGEAKETLSMFLSEVDSSVTGIVKDDYEKELKKKEDN